MDPKPLELTVKIEADLPAVVSDAVSFETGATRAEIATAETPVYEHHGEEFSTLDPGALPRFFEELVMGRVLPLTFATRSIQDVDTLVAIALFLHRDLAIHPVMPGFVYTVDFVHRNGLPALAHIEGALARFISLLRTQFPDKGSVPQKKLTQGLTWIREYIQNGQIPHLGAPPEKVRVVDIGTNGFVVAHTEGPLADGWVDLYRQGYLRGLLVNAAEGDRRLVLVSRKSAHVPFDLVMAAHLLNQMETAMGELPGWKTDGLWLSCPEDGTLILVQDILQVLTRV